MSREDDTKVLNLQDATRFMEEFKCFMSQAKVIGGVTFDRLTKMLSEMDDNNVAMVSSMIVEIFLEAA